MSFQLDKIDILQPYTLKLPKETILGTYLDQENFVTDNIIGVQYLYRKYNTGIYLYNNIVIPSQGPSELNLLIPRRI